MFIPTASVTETDLEHVIKHTENIWPKLRNACIFITGGTGFIGKWLLESLIYANTHIELNIKLVVLTRNSANFIQQTPHLALNEAVQLYEGDIRHFAFPQGEFTHVIHGAADPSPGQAWLEAYDVIVNGTQRVLNFCCERNIANLLSLSSGAVYGMQSPDLLHVSEQCMTAPQVCLPRTAYGQGKRISEWLSSVYEAQQGIQSKIARCFALAGPYLPLDTHFALGNFVLDAVSEKTITIKGDGTPRRSYLYAADMVIWLWTIFIHGQSNVAYNLGSEEAISLEDLARRVATLSESTKGVNILSPIDPTKRPEYYVPSTQLARDSLGLQAQISLDDALLRMITWVRKNRNN